MHDEFKDWPETARTMIGSNDQAKAPAADARHRQRTKVPMQEPLMCLKILLPFRVFLEREGVSRIVAETPSAPSAFPDGDWILHSHGGYRDFSA